MCGQCSGNIDEYKIYTMEKQKVSVVIPLYNVEPYIGRCLDSVLGQSYKNIEIVVVDDCGQDRSVEIVEQYCERHPNIRLIRHDRNRGLMTTRRDGYMAATGDFIVFLDSDDALPSDALATLMATEMLTDADIVLGDLLKLYVNGRTERRVGSLEQPSAPTDVLAALIDDKIIHSLCGKLFKRSLFSGSLLSFDQLTILEDGCLLYQLVARASTVASVNAMVYNYYENKASSSLGIYDSSHIEGMIIAYKTIADVCGSYVQLHDKLQRRLTLVAFSLYVEPVGAGTVRKLLSKHDMLKYGSARSAFKYLGFKDCWFLAKRFAYLRIKKGK